MFILHLAQSDRLIFLLVATSSGGCVMEHFNKMAAAIRELEHIRDYKQDPEEIIDVPQQVEQEFWHELFRYSYSGAERVARAMFALRVIQCNKANFFAAHLLAEGMTQKEVTAALEAACHHALFNLLLHESSIGKDDLEDLPYVVIKRFDGMCIVARELPIEEKAAFLCHLDTVILSRSIITRAVKIIEPYEEETMVLLPVQMQVMAIIISPHSMFFVDKSLEAMRVAAIEAVTMAITEQEGKEPKSDESGNEEEESASEQDDCLPKQGARKRKRNEENKEDEDFVQRRGFPAGVVKRR